MKDREFRMSAKALILPLFLILLRCVFGCRGKHHTEKNETAHDLPQAKGSGELVVLTLYSSTSYFIYRGQEMGFQRELNKQFTRSLGLKLGIEVAKSVRELIQKSQSGGGDMITYNLPIIKEWKGSLLYCEEGIIIHQVVVQQENGEHKPLKDVTELIGKNIYIKPGKYYDRLVNLNNELGGDIHIHEITGSSVITEDLITQVAQGKVPYTVVDNDLAKLNKTYYPNLSIDLSISFDQRSSWAVRKDNPELTAAVTNWHKKNMTSPVYMASTKRYFGNSKMIPHSPILPLKEGEISRYDDLSEKYAQEIGWDWRMLASLAYTESSFDTTAVSWAGAKGLVQLMLATAHTMGVPVSKGQNPEESIKAAVKYIAITDRSFSMIPDKQGRLNFILASYNTGLRHIYDTMALAERYGKNNLVWKDNAENFILLKNNEEYFTDPVCKSRYFRGIETFNFIRNIQSRSESYKKKIG